MDERQESTLKRLVPESVTTARPADEEIEKQIASALANNADIDASAIEVRVQDGVVELMGVVNSDRSRELAEGCLDRLPGVVELKNSLLIGEKDRDTDLPETDH